MTSIGKTIKNHKAPAVGVAIAAALLSVGGTTAAVASSSTTPKPAAIVQAVPSGTTSVALDAGFTSALSTLGLTPGVVGDAQLNNGALSFPVTGGTVTLYDKTSGYRPYVQGVLLHEGSGFSLAANGTTVEISNLVVDPGKPARVFGDVSVNGSLAAPSAPIFDLNGKTLQTPKNNADGTVTLTGTKVLLSPEATALLNQTFNTTALTNDFLIGVATINVQTSATQ